MARAPSLQEAVEVGPGNGVEGPPVLLQRGEIQGLADSLERGAQQFEVSVEQCGGQTLTLNLVEAAADEIGHVLHSATTADVLEVDRSSVASIGAEAEVRQLCITVHNGFVCRI